jgi:hypothetical protein
VRSCSFAQEVCCILPQPKVNTCLQYILFAKYHKGTLRWMFVLERRAPAAFFVSNYLASNPERTPLKV